MAVAVADVPAGTAAEVKHWMGSDPARARAVINAEEASGTPRVTLIAAAEAVIASSQEEAVSETSAPPTAPEQEQAPAFEELEPKQEPGISLSLADPSTEAYPVEVLTDDVDREAVDVTADFDPDADPEPIDAEPVSSLQLVAGTPGAVLVINGSPYSFDANGVSTLNRLVNRATAAVYH